MDATGRPETLLQFILTRSANRKYLRLALVSMVVEWGLFKLAYPFPDFFSDSYGYLRAAQENLDINIWPIGYSKFLIAFHWLTHSDLALVTFQYVVLCFASLYFFFSILYVFTPKPDFAALLFIFLMYNPLFYYISNYISTDALFCALTLIWFTQLIWVLVRPGVAWWDILIQTACVAAAFTMRYNAMYYPVITGLAYLLSRQRLTAKLAGTFLILPLILAFFLYSRDAGKALTGKPEWSILSGWQLANNALYMRGQIEVDSSKLPNQACRDLDRLSRVFFRKAGPGFRSTLEDNMGNFFIQAWFAPLKVYMVQHYQTGTERDWAMVSPLFGQYGSYLIRTHPLAYIRYYLWPNTGNYFFPPLEKLVVYNLGGDSVWTPAQQWFQYKTPRVRYFSTNFQGYFLAAYPYFFGVVNLAFAGLLVWSMFKRKFGQDPPPIRRVWLLTGTFWLINAAFSILANIIVIRYQFFPMILLTAAVLLLWDKMEPPAKTTQKQIFTPE